jgi:hypothetical protein
VTWFKSSFLGISLVVLLFNAPSDSELM